MENVNEVAKDLLTRVELTDIDELIKNESIDSKKKLLDALIEEYKKNPGATTAGNLFTVFISIGHEQKLKTHIIESLKRVIRHDVPKEVKVPIVASKGFIKFSNVFAADIADYTKKQKKRK